MPLEGVQEIAQPVNPPLVTSSSDLGHKEFNTCRAMFIATVVRFL